MMYKEKYVESLKTPETFKLIIGDFFLHGNGKERFVKVFIVTGETNYVKY